MKSSHLLASTITGQIKKPNHSILLRSKKNFLEFRPNASLHWGMKISGAYLYLEFGGKIKDTNYGNSEVGNNSYKSYRLGIPINNTFTEVFYQAWTGFSSNENKENGCEYCLDRPNLSSRDRGFHFFYALNKDFSMKALNSNGSEGVENSSSFLVALFGNRLKIRDPGGLLQGSSNEKFSFFADLTSIEMKQVGLGIGYGILLPVNAFYFGLAGIVGGGYQNSSNQKLSGEIAKEKSLGTHWRVKTMVATHGDGLNIGLKGFLFSNIYNVSDSNNVASLNYSVYLYSSYSW